MNNHIDIIQNDKMEYIEKLEKLKTNYYNDNIKNSIFKKKQKMECASIISREMDIEQLMDYTICIIPNTNKIHIDYTIFKTYANPEIYENINTKLINVLNKCKELNTNFEIFINIDTLTISALDRYRNLLQYFSKICNDDELKYTDFLQRCVMYNSPSFVDNIKMFIFPFLTPKTRNMIEFYHKKDSDFIKNELFNDV
jgi:hypothetical protein